MMIDLVVVAPQPLEGRHGDDDQTTGDTYPVTLTEDSHIVFAVLDHIQCSNQVERGVLKGYVLRLPQPDIITPFVSDLDRFGVVLDTDHRTVTTQMVEHVTCTTTDIEDTLVPVRNKPIHHVEQRPRAAGKPPMFIFFYHL